MFISDNASGVHPKVLQALLDCNSDHVMPYGNDPITEKAIRKFQTLFGKKTDVAFVLTGTGANVIGLSALLRPFESVITATTSHVAVDECGALERFSGSKIEGIHCPDGKLSPKSIEPYLTSAGNEHHTQPKVISISQVSEMGTVYLPEEIRALADFAHKHNMLLHMDGARIANAAVSLSHDFKTFTVDAGVDILSFGGTKNGMMLGEAIVSFRPELTRHLNYVRKQGLHLASKMRYISAQFLTYLNDDLWHQNASHANQMASLIADVLKQKASARLAATPQANMIFARIPTAWNAPLMAVSPFYILDETTNLIRLVTSYDTTEKEVRTFIDVLDTL